MASPIHQPESPDVSGRPETASDLMRSRQSLLADGWSPTSTDPGPELGLLLPVLDQVRGEVTRLLLSAGGWTARPHEIVVGTRKVTIGYLAAQHASIMTVLCADGGSFTVRVAPPGKAAERPPAGSADASRTANEALAWLRKAAAR